MAWAPDRSKCAGGKRCFCPLLGSVEHISCLFPVGDTAPRPPTGIAKDPACTDVADLFRKGRALAAKNKEKAASNTAADGKATSSSSVGETDDHAASSSRNDGCPLDKGELGAATWGLVSQASIADKVRFVRHGMDDRCCGAVSVLCITGKIADIEFSLLPQFLSQPCPRSRPPLWSGAGRNL